MDNLARKNFAFHAILMALGLILSGCAHDPFPSGDPATRPAVSKIDQAVARGVEFLRKSQNADGSWGTGTETRGFEVMASVPGSHDGFRVATTALCVMALREAGETEAHRKGVEYLINHGDSRRAEPMMIYNIWAHMYALEALALEMRRDNDPRLKRAAQWQLDRLQRYQTYLGGWNYYDFKAQTQSPSMGPTSFGTAAGLIALWEARKSGIEVPQRMIDLSVHRLEEMRLPDGAYLYGEAYKYIPRLPANRVRGSIGRMQSCNTALLMWKSKRVTPEQAIEGLETFFREHDYINMGRKRPMPHESWYQTAAYYYYFGHYYAAQLLDLLGPEAKKRFGGPLADAIVQYQEPDGSWWDFAMWDYHKPYGTAFAVMTLVRVRDAAGAPSKGG